MQQFVLQWFDRHGTLQHTQTETADSMTALVEYMFPVRKHTYSNGSCVVSLLAFGYSVIVRTQEDYNAIYA